MWNRYILEKYDTTKEFSGGEDVKRREEVRRFVHMSEGVFMMHMLAIPFSRWFATPGCEELKKIERGMLEMVWKDLDVCYNPPFPLHFFFPAMFSLTLPPEKWLETHLKTNKSDYLVGNTLTAADTMMLFSIQLIFKRYCGDRSMQEWAGIKAWVERCEAREGWKQCVRETGHLLPWGYRYEYCSKRWKGVWMELDGWKELHLLHSLTYLTHTRKCQEMKWNDLISAQAPWDIFHSINGVNFITSSSRFNLTTPIHT